MRLLLISSLLLCIVYVYGTPPLPPLNMKGVKTNSGADKTTLKHHKSLPSNNNKNNNNGSNGSNGNNNNGVVIKLKNHNSISGAHGSSHSKSHDHKHKHHGSSSTHHKKSHHKSTRHDSTTAHNNHHAKMGNPEKHSKNSSSSKPRMGSPKSSKHKKKPKMGSPPSPDNVPRRKHKKSHKRVKTGARHMRANSFIQVSNGPCDKNPCKATEKCIVVVGKCPTYKKFSYRCRKHKCVPNPTGTNPDNSDNDVAIALHNRNKVDH